MTTQQTISKSHPRPALSYGLKEASALTGLSRSTLYNLMSAGRLSSIKVGSRRLITASSLDALINGVG